jgi:RsiW-degrading membrane proteinase PrsW (M82 family)
MLIDLIFKYTIALAPVMVFLAVLVKLDSHRLLGYHIVVWSIITGVVPALASYAVNDMAIDLFSFDFTDYTRYGAPIVEETLKALILVYMFRRNHIGFLIDAAILGFAVGAGFSLAENLFYLTADQGHHYGVWTIRGFGTAIMHGGATAIFAVVSQILTERHATINPLYYIPGLIAAIILHSIFNHFPFTPVLSTAVTLFILPILFFLLFEKNEEDIHNWLEQDFKAHKKLLKQIDGGDFTHCEAGRFLVDLRKTFSGAVVEDMIQYLRLHTELIIDAERLLLDREQKAEVSIGEDIRTKLHEMHELEDRIGKIAFHAMQPHLNFSRKELWEIYMLEEQSNHHGLRTFI